MITIPLALDWAQAGPFVAITQGYTHCYEVVIAQGQVFDLNTTQVGHCQDWTLRCWISQKMIGPPVVRDPAYLAEWHAARYAGRTVRVHDISTDPSPAPVALGLAPQTYFINIMNLTNAVNHYRVSLTPVG